jgi:hypothetical protein
MNHLKITKLFPSNSKLNILPLFKISLILSFFAIIYIAIEECAFGRISDDLNAAVPIILIAVFAFAPVAESVVLIFTIWIFKKIGFKSKYYLLIIATLAMLAHIPGRSDLKALPIQFFAFYIFASYVDFRSRHTKRIIILWEAIIMHSSYNVFCLLFMYLYLNILEIIYF